MVVEHRETETGAERGTDKKGGRHFQLWLEGSKLSTEHTLGDSWI